MTELVFIFVNGSKNVRDGYGFVGDWFDDWDDRALEPFETEAEAIKMGQRLMQSYRGRDSLGTDIRLDLHTYP